MLWSTEHLYEGPNLSIHLNLNKILKVDCKMKLDT